MYKCPVINLSPLWQLLLWHQVANATAIPSGIISLCINGLVYWATWFEIWKFRLLSSCNKNILYILGCCFTELWCSHGSFLQTWHWRNRRGQYAPVTFFTRKFFLTYWENRGKEKREMEKKRRKIVKGKVVNYKWSVEGGEVWKFSRGLFFFFFFFFLLFTFWNHENLFGV